MDPGTGQEPPRVRDIPVGLDASGTRTETDALGAVAVPANHYWGAQTQRSLTYFSIGDDVMPAAIYHAYGYVKKACAIVNARHGVLPQWRAGLIGKVADEVALRSGVSEEVYDQIVVPERMTRPGVARPASQAPPRPGDAHPRQSAGHDPGSRCAPGREQR